MDQNSNGTVNRLVFGCIAGWAKNPSGNERVAVIVNVNGKDVAEAVADKHHPGLAEQGIGDGKFGFRIAIPQSAFRKTGDNLIRIRIKDTGKELKGSPLAANFASSTGRLVDIHAGCVHGWAAPMLQTPLDLRVELIADGLSRGAFPPEIVRDDLKAYGLADQPSGLRIRLPADLMDGEEHAIALRIAGQDQLLRGSPKQFKAAAKTSAAGIATPIAIKPAGDSSSQALLSAQSQNTPGPGAKPHGAKPHIDIEAARKLRAKGDKAAAFDLLQAFSPDAIVRSNHANANQVADEWLSWDEFDRAREIYDRILAVSPGNAWARFGKTKVLRGKGDPKGALQATLELLEGAPAQLQFLLAAANDHEMLGQDIEALARVDRAIEIDPSLNAAYAQKLRILERQGDDEAHLTLLEDLVARYPENIGWRAKYIAIRRQQGARIWALEAFAKLAGEFPDSAPALIQAGVSARYLGLSKLALDWFDQAAAKADETEQADMHCVIELLKLGRLDDARHRLDALHGDTELPHDLVWPSILLTASESREAAAQRYRRHLLQEQDISRLTRLIQQGRQHGFAFEAESALRDHEQAWTDSWDFLVLRLELLLDLGQRRAARALLAQWPESRLTPAQKIRSAELWHELGYPSRASAMLAEGVEQMLLIPSVASGEADHAIRVCHQFGNYGMRDRLFRKHGLPPSPSNAQRVLNHAMLLAVDGRGSESENLLETLARNAPDLPLHGWQARIAHQNQDYPAARRLLESPVSQPIVPLEDARLLIRAMIDAEEIDRAESELDRLEGRYADCELAPLRAEILNLNLQFEDAHEYLHRMLRQYPQDRKLSLMLAESLLGYGQLAEAGKLIERGIAAHPASLEWGSLQLSWTTASASDWNGWLAAHRQLRRRLGFGNRLRLTLTCFQHLLQMGQHEGSAHLLRRLVRRLQDWPLADTPRVAYSIQCAGPLALLNQPAESYRLLGQVAETFVPPARKDSFFIVSSLTESYGNRNPEIFVSHRNQVRKPRHHIEFTPFSSTPEFASNATPPLRVAVLLHLYYQDLWPEFRSALDSLVGTDFRLFVTIPGHGLDDEIARELRAIDPGVQIVAVENRGFDIGAHWQALDRIRLAEFDLALLLQTKKSKHVRIGHLWRDNLVSALIGSPARWRENLHAFHARPDIGMIGSCFHHQTWDPWHYREMREVIEALGLPSRFDEIKVFFQYVGGTMFLIRAPLLQEIHAKTRNRLRFRHYDELSLAKRMDRSPAHAMERAFGIYVKWRGFDILWRN